MNVVPGARSLADMNLRIEIKRLLDRVATRGDPALAAILSTAVMTIDQRISAGYLEIEAGRDDVTVVNRTLPTATGEVPVRIELEIWELFLDFAQDLFRAPDRMSEFLAQGSARQGASLIRLYVLRCLLERSETAIAAGWQ